MWVDYNVSPIWNFHSAAGQHFVFFRSPPEARVVWILVGATGLELILWAPLYPQALNRRRPTIHGDSPLKTISVGHVLTGHPNFDICHLHAAPAASRRAHMSPAPPPSPRVPVSSLRPPLWSTT